MTEPRTAPACVLVVEDDETIRRTLRYNLQQEGYAVHEAATGTEALTAARRLRPDLILLDLMLPGMSGLEVCRVLRQEMTTPIIAVTAKATELDTVTGLRVGVDDYVTKPFSLPELLARIAALLRRAQLSVSEAPQPDAMVTIGKFQLNRDARTVHIDGVEVHLAPREFDLLSFLLGRPGKVQSRDGIIQHVWGSRFYGEAKTVDVHVRWLREKFEPFEHLPLRITTVFGVGYRLDVEPQARPRS